MDLKVILKLSNPSREYCWNVSLPLCSNFGGDALVGTGEVAADRSCHPAPTAHFTLPPTPDSLERDRGSLGRPRFVECSSSLHSTVCLKQPSECTLQENLVSRHCAADPHPKTFTFVKPTPRKRPADRLVAPDAAKLGHLVFKQRAKRCVLTGNTSASTDTPTTGLQKFFDVVLCRPLTDWRPKHPNIRLFTRSQELIRIESVLR